uniref:Secreted protein n=1 Tax=Glossina palpalis gambiensis TaxID=67801 RepID=A0A1B0B9V7_9MUSC
MRNWLVNLVGFVIVVVVAALCIEPGTVVIAKPQLANGLPTGSRPSERFQRTENFAAPPADLDRPLVLLPPYIPIVEEGTESNHPPNPRFF